MIIGNIRHRIGIYIWDQTEEQDGAGTYNTFTKVKDTWANIEAINGLVRLDSKQIGEDITHKFTIRYWPLVSTLHWIKYGKRNFQIKNVRNLDERNQYLELMVTEVYDDKNQIQADIGEAGDPIES